MGLNVLLLADSTSRWAQAMREMSGRLEEIPGEEAFPAYLESVIASFYERAGVVRLKDGSTGSVTIGGTVSPAGGNFEEPVTQATLKVVGAFHGLSRDRSDARKYPAIHPLESWSKYPSAMNDELVSYCRDILLRGNEVSQMMKVVGEEGTSLDDYILFQKSEFLDSVYMQQNSFDPIDGSVTIERQRHVFRIMFDVLASEFDFNDKDSARNYFNQIRQVYLDYNTSEWKSDAFKSREEELTKLIDEKKKGYDPVAEDIRTRAGSAES
jgi:V/A-type H+-transporting ATPase subunit A